VVEFEPATLQLAVKCFNYLAVFYFYVRPGAHNDVRAEGKGRSM